MRTFQVMSTDTSMQSDDFYVWQPDSVDLMKSQDNSDRWNIQGYCSTEALDRQGETVFQKGLDFSEFVNHGWYNDNHKQETAAAIGIPEVAEYHKGKGWFTRGYLLKSVAKAQDIYNLAKALVGTPRRLGFSIEGKVLERKDNKIVKAVIRNVAITNSPVNTECTWDLMAKSFADTEKALSVGHARAAESGGRVLAPEDLEQGEIKYVYGCPHCKKGFAGVTQLEEHIGKRHHKETCSSSTHRADKSMTQDEAFEFVRKVHPEYSEAVARRFVDYVFDNQR